MAHRCIYKGILHVGNCSTRQKKRAGEVATISAHTADPPRIAHARVKVARRGSRIPRNPVYKVDIIRESTSPARFANFFW